MAGLGEPAVVDLVAQDAEGNALLVIVETRGWGTDVRAPQLLRAKTGTRGLAFVSLNSRRLRAQPVSIQRFFGNVGA